MADKILVVDSDLLFLEEFKKKLTAALPSLDVSTAYDGQEVLKKVRREHPVLLIIEDSLASIDGYKLSRFLKFDKRYRTTPLFLLTHHIDEENAALAKEVGANEFLIRSKENDIIEKIKAYLKDKEQ